MTAFALPCANKRLQATRSKQRAPEAWRWAGEARQKKRAAALSTFAVLAACSLESKVSETVVPGTDP